MVFATVSSSSPPPVVLLGQVCVAISVLAPAIGAAASWRSTRSASGPRVAATMTGIAAISAIALWTVVAIHGPIALEAPWRGRGPLVGLYADHLTVTLLTLICGVGALIQSYALRYLRTDTRARQFFLGSGVLVASMALVATSATAPGLVAGWVLAGWAFVAIVGYRSDLAGVAVAVRRTRRLLVFGDGALLVAVALLSARAGNVDLAVRGGASPASLRLGSASIPIALLLVLSVLTRSAQGPLGRWLPTTVAAPTPVSALLHAGFVNGGGILLVRFGMLSSDSLLAMIVAFSVSAVTAGVAMAVMSKQPDVKGALAFSTMGQMGFMIAECTVGAAGAAMVHLVGHAIYKATMFLGSGGLVPRNGGVTMARDPRCSLARLAVSGTAGGTAAGAVAMVPGLLEHRGGALLLMFIAATAGAAVWSGWIEHRPTLIAGWTAMILVGSVIYGLAAGSLAAWLQPALPSLGAGALSPWLLTVVFAFVLTFSLLSRASRFGTRLQILLIHAGSVSRESGIRTTLATRSTRRGTPAAPLELGRQTA